MITARYALLSFIYLLGILPGATSAQPYTISTDGTEVTDLATGLIWRRCAEGLQGSVCTGTVSYFTHQAALQHAASISSSTAVAWRLPNVKELSSIVDISKSNPAIDSTAFPSTPIYYFWSATPYVSNASGAWVAEFGQGKISPGGRGTISGGKILMYNVRLVRAGQ